MGQEINHGDMAQSVGPDGMIPPLLAKNVSDFLTCHPVAVAGWQ